MSSFTTIPDTTLAQDKPFTQSIARALRDNPKAIAEGDASAPDVSTKAINSQYIRVTKASQFTGGVNDVVLYDVEVYDPDNLYDPATGRFQPTVAGVYMIGAKLATSSMTAGNLEIRVNKNGALYDFAIQYDGAASVVRNPAIETIVQMNGTTDYIEIRTGNTGGNYTFNSQFWAIGMCEI